jgi:hypothetical protein
MISFPASGPDADKVETQFLGARDLVPVHKFADFHANTLPGLVVEHGGLVVDDLRGVSPIAFVASGGASITYIPSERGIDLEPGCKKAKTLVELDGMDFSDFVNEVHTAGGLAMGGKLHFERGALPDLQRWEPALRALYHGRPIWTASEAAKIVDDKGQAIDFTKTFTPEDSDTEMAQHLATAGFLHVRGVFGQKDLESLGAEVNRVRDAIEPGTGEAWWSTTTSGEQVVTRINYLDRWSERIKAACFDARVQRFGKLLDADFRVCDDRLDGPMVFVKNSNVAQGLGNLNWHQDDGLGGHPVMCPLIQVGVQLDSANPENGQLWVLAGSHRYSNHPMLWGDEDGQPVVKIETEPGDVTVHFGDILHTTPPPTGENAGRRVLYFKFAMPKTFEAIPAGAHYNDLLFKHGAGGRVATRAATWSDDDTQEGFEVARFEDRDVD